MTDQARGAGVGRKIAELTAEAAAKVRTATAPMEEAVKMRGRAAQMETWERELGPIVNQLVADLRGVEGMPDHLRSLLDEAAAPQHQVGFLVQMVTLLSFSFQAVFSLGEPLVAKYLQDVWRQYPDNPLSAAEAAAAWRRNVMDRGEAEREASRTGYDEVRLRNLYDLTRRYPDVGELLTAVNRGTVPMAGARERLDAMGFEPPDIDLLLSLRLAFPGPADLVRFAVREVFTPGVAQRYGQYADLPGEFLDLATKAGMSREFATWYWAAHWELPSLTQGYEMLHRGVIDEAELSNLMRAQDVMPYWRDKLQKISYAPYTRVDVRRMYVAGVLDREAVYRSYRDIGYDHEKATKLTEWTTAEKLEEERHLAKGEVVALYESRAIDRARAVALLRELGYGDDEAALVLDLGDHRRDRQRRDRSVSVVRARYIGFKINEAEAVTALDRIGVPAEERTELFEVWDVERELSEPDLTRADLVRFAKKGIIDFDTFVMEMRARGWSDQEIGWIIEDASQGG